MVQKHLGQRVRDLREKKGLSPQRLAERSGVPLSTIRVLECGRYKPSLTVFRRLVDALGLSKRDVTFLLAAVPLEHGVLPCEAVAA